MAQAQVSIILPVFNAGALLPGAINSIGTQAGVALEIIAIDDGSQDGSWEVLAAQTDPRIRASRQDNAGLAATLNRGIALAAGRYIARMDQDDVALPGRLAKQAAFLDDNPAVAMVGTWSQIYVNDSPTQRYHRHPCSNEALQLELLFDNPFVHSSMMIRADVLQEVGGYCEDKSRQPPEDYELWSRIARRHRVANLPEVLTVYREVAGSMSRSGESPFLANVVRIATENLAHVLGPRYTAADCSALAELYHRGGHPGFPSALTKTAARRMLEEAARRIGSNEANWSAEFRSSYARMRNHLDSRFLKRRIPRPLLNAALWMKRRLLQRRHG
jgi:glycosyltransferase involved in cell wall biosynthesis